MNKWKRKTTLFLLSQGVSLFGSSIVQFAIIWYVTKETLSGVLVSLLTVCAFVPQMLISFVSGAWADRHSKKLLIIISDAVIALATLALALLMPSMSGSGILVAALMVTSIIRSLGTGVQQPAVNAFLPQIVPQEKLMKVNGVNSAIQAAVQFAAPAVAAAVLTVSSVRNALFIDIATAAAGIGLLCCIALPDTVKTESESASMLEDVKAGASYTFSDPFLKKLLLQFGAFIFLCVPAGFMSALFVTRNYGAGYANMSIVEIVGFAGMMLGGLLIGGWGGFRNRLKTLMCGMLMFGLLAVGMGLIKNFIVYLALMAVYGVALTAIQTAVTTLIQEKSRPDMQGRVFGFMNIIYSGFLPLGMAVFGPLSDCVSLNLLMVISGVLLAAGAVMISLDRKYYIMGIAADTQEKQAAEA